jgi:hypothetical protein
MSSPIIIQEKKDECNRIINNISEKLRPILAALLGLESLNSSDFNTLLYLVKDNYNRLTRHFHVPFSYADVCSCIDLRNKVAHQDATSIRYLKKGIQVLNRCQAAFNIQSSLVPLRLLACKVCGTTTTRTAQPTITFISNNQPIKTSRTYDVQVYTVANDREEICKREDSWYDGWIWHTTYCGPCRQAGTLTKIGRRYDWAPEDRINLSECEVRYVLANQAAMVTYHNETVKDLTHVVSDGKIRRHFYTLYENKMREVIHT